MPVKTAVGFPTVSPLLNKDRYAVGWRRGYA
jgi:hypothetical protein